jgi:3-hydroxyisobutyrate dehydrogenase-like beta-hydroxyacid dehydrogenase
LAQSGNASAGLKKKREKMKIALIGYGEVGQIFARELRANGAQALSTFDILFQDVARSEKHRAAAARDGILMAASAAEAGADADVIISAVTADKVKEVASQAATWLKAGQYFLDVNSAAPNTKSEAAKIIAPTGAHYVEGAVMAPVPGPGIKVQILSGGPKAEELAPQLNALGMNIQPVASEYGRASAMKLCRSIMIKGIEALIVDCAKAAKEWNVEKEVFGSLDASYPSIDWRKLSVDMAGRVRQHGVRRGAEMREAAAMVADLGMMNELELAVAGAQERGAGKAGL